MLGSHGFYILQSFIQSANHDPESVLICFIVFAVIHLPITCVAMCYANQGSGDSEFSAEQMLCVLKAVQEDGEQLLSEYDPKDPASICLREQLSYCDKVHKKLSEMCVSKHFQMDNINSTITTDFNLFVLLVFNILAALLCM